MHYGIKNITALLLLIPWALVAGNVGNTFPNVIATDYNGIEYETDNYRGQVMLIYTLGYS